MDHEKGGIPDRLAQGKSLLDYLGKRSNRSLIGQGRQWAGKEIRLKLNEFYLYHIEEITYEEKAPRKEALENILGTFRGMDGISFIYMILGNESSVDFYFGVAKDYSYTKQELFSAENVGSGMLLPSIKGNFRGSTVTSVNARERERILRRLQQAHAVGIMEGVPGIDKDNEDLQGVDRLIDVMFGGEFGFIVIARPYTDEEVDEVEKQLHTISDVLAPLVKHTLQHTHSDVVNKNDTDMVTMSRQAGKSTQQTNSASSGTSNGETSDIRHDQSNQMQASTNNGTNRQWADSKSFSKNKTDSTGDRNRTDNSENTGNSSNESCSVQQQSNYAYTNNVGDSNSQSNAHTETTNKSDSKTKNISESFAKNRSHSEGNVTSDNTSLTEQMEVEVKAGMDWLKYIDEVLLPRLDDGRGKGLFQSCTYVFGENRAMLHRLANTAISLYSGPSGNKSALFFRELSDKPTEKGCVNALQNLQIPSVIKHTVQGDYMVTAFSRCDSSQLAYCGSWLSTNELALLTGLPHKEVIGLSLKEEVEFGLNIKDDLPEDRRIELGSLVQCGDIKKNVPVYLNRDNLDKHTFVTGVTGSGKTTTCQNILIDCGLPFLVIEPAKTEYRILKDTFPDLLFFTPGRQDIAPFFLNPFELFPGEAITSRADMIKATLEASFEMEAAIPQIMEAGVYRAYENRGWDIGSNTWNGKDEDDADGPFADGVYAFPTLADFKAAVKEITEEQGFDDRLKNDYLGSINARIQSLLVGSKGMMLNTPRSIDFSALAERQVVIELEEIKNGEEKSLIMGFILTNLMQAVKAKHNAWSKQQRHFQHITLVEEAHRLFSRFSPGDSLNKKHGVEVFSDMLAEVRKYGESLIIADQIPDKMTPEVLKNTNTKIVHKIFAQDDKEAIGNTMALDDDQKSFLSNLAPGRAIVFTQGWSRAVQVQVREMQQTNGYSEVSPDDIYDISLQYYAEPETIRRGVLRGLEKWEAVTQKEVEDYLWLQRHDNGALRMYYDMFMKLVPLNSKKFTRFIQAVKQMNQKVSMDFLVHYFYWSYYPEMNELRWKKLKDFLDKVLNKEDIIPDIINRYNVLKLSVY